MALLLGIELDLAVVFETGRNAAVRRDGLDRGEVAIGDAVRPIGCGELDAFADTYLAVDLSISAATLKLVGARIDGTEIGLWRLRPVQHHAPLHECQNAFANVAIELHDWLNAFRGNVMGGREAGAVDLVVLVVEHFGVVGMAPLCDPLLVRSPAVTSAHEPRLDSDCQASFLSPVVVLPPPVSPTGGGDFEVKAAPVKQPLLFSRHRPKAPNLLLGQRHGAPPGEGWGTALGATPPDSPKGSPRCPGRSKTRPDLLGRLCEGIYEFRMFCGCFGTSLEGLLVALTGIEPVF